MSSGAVRKAASAFFAASMTAAVISVIWVPAAGAAARPDLVVQGFQFKSTAPYGSAPVAHVVIEQGKHGSFGLVFKVKNVGKARAHKSTARIVINGQKIGEVQVGPLAQGRAITVRKTFDARFAGPGRFKVFSCADFGNPRLRVRESNERNNCSRALFFRAVPRRWNVETFSTGPNSLTGGAPFFAARSVAGMTFDFAGVVNEAGQLYFLWLATGSVTGSVSGADSACTYSGEGSVSHSPWDLLPPAVGYLEIGRDQDIYFAEIKDEEYTFVATQTCPGYPINQSTHSILTLETIGLDGRIDRLMEENDRTLAGTYTIPTGFGGGSTVGAWSFKADL